MGLSPAAAALPLPLAICLTSWRAHFCGGVALLTATAVLLAIGAYIWLFCLRPLGKGTRGGLFGGKTEEEEEEFIRATGLLRKENEEHIYTCKDPYDQVTP